MPAKCSHLFCIDGVRLSVPGPGPTARRLRHLGVITAGFLSNVPLCLHSYQAHTVAMCSVLC